MGRLLVLGWLVVGLPGAVAQAPLPVSIEQVHSVKSAEHFMRSLSGDFAELTLDSLLVDDQANCAYYQLHPADTLAADQLDTCARYAVPPSKAWVKADFDQDGQLDLLINKGFGEVYCVLNRGSQPPRVIPVADHWRRWWDCYSFKVMQVNDRAVIAHLQIRGPRPTHRGQHQDETIARQDTLVYRLGSFVEYNPRPADRPGRRLAFYYFDGGPPPRTIFGLTVNLKTGWVWVNFRSCRSERQVPLLGKWHYRLGAGLLDTLRQQVAYVPVTQLAPEYALNAYDASTYRVTFYRPAHRPRCVEDYGGDGPYTLQQLYKWLYTTFEQALAQHQQQLRLHPSRP